MIAYKGNANRQGEKELYHIANDPFEKSNLAKEKQEKVRELSAVLEKLQKDDELKLPEDLKGLKN